MARTKPELDAGWSKFEADVDKYVDTFGQQAQQQQAIFKDAAAAQLKAWRHAAEQLHGAAAKFAAERRSDADAAIKRMKAGAAEAEASLQQLGQASATSWAALRSALAGSREAFDRTNRAASEAVKRPDKPASRKAGRQAKDATCPRAPTELSCMRALRRNALEGEKPVRRFRSVAGIEVAARRDCGVAAGARVAARIVPARGCRACGRVDRGRRYVSNACPPQETVEERELRDQLAEFVNQVTQFFEQSEKNIAAHPAESVVGALVVGILIGLLLGRR